MCMYNLLYCYQHGNKSENQTRSWAPYSWAFPLAANWTRKPPPLLQQHEIQMATNVLHMKKKQGLDPGELFLNSCWVYALKKEFFFLLMSRMCLRRWIWSCCLCSGLLRCMAETYIRCCWGCGREITHGSCKCCSLFFLIALEEDWMFFLILLSLLCLSVRFQTI